MEFLITEEQLRLILSEGGSNKFSSAMKALSKFTTDLVKNVAETYGVNLRMFLTFSTSVGGILLPLDTYVRSGEFSLTDEQRMLLLAGVCFILLFEGKRGITRLLREIKKANLEKEFNLILSKGRALKLAFKEFMSSLGGAASFFMDIVAYTFLIPIITDIADFAQKSKNIQQTAMLIAERLISSGVVLMTKEVLTNLLSKLMKRFK